MCNKNCKNCKPKTSAEKLADAGVRLDWHEEADAVGYWAASSVESRPQLVKKTNYPASFSLTNAQYRMAMNGGFSGVTIVDARLGVMLFVENEWGLRDVLKKAVPKTTVNGVIYWVVRF